MMSTTRLLARPMLVAVAFAVLAACNAGPGVRESEPTATRAPEALLADGDAALERGDVREASGAYLQAALGSEDEAVAEQATRVAFGNFQLQDATRAAERWLALNPSSEEARRYAGVAALELHRLDTAEQHFADLIETAYLSPAAGFLALLPVIADQGTPADVTELFQRLSARHPAVAEGRYVVGSAALRSENYALAQRSAEDAVRLATYWVPARMLLARAQIATGQEEAGLATARELVTAPEADIATHLEYALLLASTGRDEEARAMLVPYATGRTVVPGALRSLGILDLQHGDLDAASARFEALLSTGSQSYEALYYLGIIAERRKDPERALRYFARVTGGDLELPAQQRIARIKAEQSGLEAGLAHLEEFGRGRTESGPDIIAARAGLLSAFGDERRALGVLDAGIERYPDSTDLRMARVFAYERVARNDAAVNELRGLLRQRPGDPVVENALGYTLADQGRQLDEAGRLVASALEQMPDSAAVLDSMGWVLFRRGKTAEALEYLERARRQGDDAEIDLHLGEVQWALGDKAGARKTWQEALERHPDAKTLEQRLERAGP